MNNADNRSVTPAIADYLVEDVLTPLPEEIRRFLFQTSVLDRLCGPLFDAVIGRDDGQEVLETLELTMVAEQRTARVVLPADAVEAQLFEALGHAPLHIDEIRSRTEIPIEKVTATLALMELKGMVRQVGGMQYIALREVKEAYQDDNKIAG